MNKTLRICTIVWYLVWGAVLLWFVLRPAYQLGGVWVTVLIYLYAAPFIGALPDLINAIARHRRQIRIAAQWRSDHCAHCNYDLHGIERDVCPECGNDLSEVKSAKAP